MIDYQAPRIETKKAGGGEAGPAREALAAPADRAVLPAGNPGDVPMWRWVAGFGVALVADGLSLLAGTFGAFAPPVQVFIDLCTMAALFLLLGFRIAFLPAFAAELFPGLSAFPCWTLAVAAVASGLRR